MNQKVLEIYKKVLSDNNLKEKFKNAKTEEEVFKLIKDLGYDLTKKDIVINKPGEGTEIDMQELEKVSGAGGCGCVGGGWGEGSNSIGEFQCGCAMAGVGLYGMFYGGYDSEMPKHGLCTCFVAGAGATNEAGC